MTPDSGASNDIEHWDREAKELDAAVPSFDSRWRESANCASVGLDPFYPESDTGRVEERLAKRICAACPVLMECRADGLNEPYGVWGGLNRYQRRYLRAAVKRNELDVPSRTIYSPEELGLVPSTNSFAGNGGWRGSDASLEAIGRLKPKGDDNMTVDYHPRPETTDAEYNALRQNRDDLIRELAEANRQLQQHQNHADDGDVFDQNDAYAGVNHAGLGW